MPSSIKQQRDRHVEDQPDDAAGMAVGQAREEIRPGERPGIGVHHVDLQLRDDHEGGHQQQGGVVGGDHVAEGASRYICAGSAALVDGHARARSVSTTRKEPASSFGAPMITQPGPARKTAKRWRHLAAVVRRQEAQEVDLFADLRHQRQDDGGGRAEHRRGREGAIVPGRPDAWRMPAKARQKSNFFPVQKRR